MSVQSQPIYQPGKQAENENEACFNGGNNEGQFLEGIHMEMRAHTFSIYNDEINKKEREKKQRYDSVPWLDNQIYSGYQRILTALT